MKKEKQLRYDTAYLNMAKEWSKLSYCTRKKVGAILVKDQVIISDGYNGTPTGFDNCCEDEDGDTNWYVLHAEANALMKLAQSTESSKDAVLFITHFPCIECAKLIYQAGISKVYYGQFYEASKGCGESFLKKAGIELYAKT